MMSGVRTVCVAALFLMTAASSAVQIDVSRKVSGNATSANATMTTTTIAPALLSTTAIPPTTTAPSILQANATAAPNSTASNATQSPADAPWPNGQQNRRPHHGRTRSSGECACDLTINLCDINCCCDTDCDERALGSFVCTASADDYDQSLGGLHSCEVQNDWLCVIARRPTVREATGEGTYDPDRRSVIKHRWSPIYPEITTTTEADNHRSAYRFGDTVHAFFADSPTIVQPFRISAPLATAEHCTLQLPVRFMAETTVQCRRSSAAHVRYIVDMRRQLLGAMLPITKHVNLCNNTSHVNMTANATTPTPNCVHVQLYECLHQIEPAACRLQRNETVAPDDESATDGMENHLIRIDIVHDFEQILNCSVYLVYSEDSLLSDVRHSIVHFQQLNETLISHHEVSGPGGYTAGLPVIVSHMRPANISTPNSELVLDYFHPNGSSDRTHVLRIPRIDADGRCVVANGTMAGLEPIVVGQDFRVKCDIPLRRPDDAEISATGTNFTELCVHMQLTIFEHLLADVRHGYAVNWSSSSGEGVAAVPTLISMLGNPVNRTERWTTLRWAEGFDDLADMLPAVSGDVLLGNADEGDDGGADTVTGFRCAQMVLSVRYEFAIVWAGSGQWHVREASVGLGTRLDVRFANDDLDEWRVPVFVEGQFLDLTASAATTARSSCLISLVFIAIVANYNYV